MSDLALLPCLPAAGTVARGISRLCLPVLVWAALLCPTQPAAAGFTQRNVPKLTASDSVEGAEQGFAVAVSADGNTAIVGGPFDNSGVGAAWVFTRSGGTWTQQQKLTANDSNGAAELGWSVALSDDGNTAIVGGPGDNNSIGAAWMFTRSGNVWSQQGAKLSGTGATGTGCAQPGVVGNAEQGYSVALSGDGNTAIVGGWADNSSLGAAWVFARGGGAWSQPAAKLCGSGATASTNILQGFSVALSDDGTTAIVGGPNDHDGVGAAWVFTSSGGTWTQQGGKLVDSTGVTSQQGFSVALASDGNTALVGGPGEETPGTDMIDGTSVSVTMSNGAVRVFTRSGGAWSQQGDKLVGTSGTQSSPGQGFSVALAGGGNTALVGGPTDNANTGAAWVFARSGGTWNQQASKLVGSGAVGAASQATSVALSGDGNTVIIGGPTDNADTGAAWVFVSYDAVAAHDFNGDGKSDILWRNASTGEVVIWLMNGGSIASAVSLGIVATNWSVVGTGDFNGDGKSDILWRDTAGDVGIWLMNGTTPMQQVVIGNVATNWSVVGTGDFNGDGNSDILWRDTVGDVGIWLMSGTTPTQKIVIGNVSTNWSIVGIGDFNGDGKSDILWEDTAGDFVIWLMNGSQYTAVSVATVPTSWRVQQTGDFNGDGKSDILWWNSSTGEVTISFMNGGSITSGVSFGNVPNVWSIQSLNAN